MIRRRGISRAEGETAPESGRPEPPFFWHPPGAVDEPIVEAPMPIRMPPQGDQPIGETPEGMPIYGPMDPGMDYPVPRIPYATGFPPRNPPRVPFDGGNNRPQGPGLLFWILVGAVVYAAAKE